MAGLRIDGEGLLGCLSPRPSMPRGKDARVTLRPLMAVPKRKDEKIVPRQMMKAPKIISSFNPGYEAPSIACAAKGLAWVRTGYTKLQLMDRHGTVKETVDTDFWFNDIAVTQQGEVLLADCTNNCIKSVSQSKAESVLLNTQLAPFGICCLQSGHIIVAFGNESKVIKCEREGTFVHEFDSKLTKRPRGIAENPVNKDICVCNESDNVHESEGKVFGFDRNNELRYTYTGSDPGSFTPKDVCTDTQGNVLVTDHTNNKVHILDKDGHFLQYLLTSAQGVVNPWYIDVDSEGNAWVGEYGGQVKIVKYFSA